MPENAEISDELKQRHVVNAADAREQASEGQYSFLRSEFRRGNPTKEHPEGEVFEIPHKDLFDFDQQDRWDTLIDELNNEYDREPDVYTPPDEKGNRTLIAKGALIVPHKKKGERLPQWPYRLAVVLWGEDGAKRAKAAGINLNEIEIVWAKQDEMMRERAQRDPKSGAGGAGVAPASN